MLRCLFISLLMKAINVIHKSKSSATITLGKKAPYHYLEHFHPQGYEMFMEGLLFHELASLRYCDFQILSQTYIQASQALTQVNSAAKDFLNKQMSYRELKSIIIKLCLSNQSTTCFKSY